MTGSDAPSHDRRLTAWPTSFEELWSTYQKPLAFFASRILRRNPGSAVVEDAVQEIIAKVVASRRRFRPEQNLRTWVYSIARNHCVDIVRSERRRSIVPMGDGAELISAAREPEGELIRNAEQEAVHNALGRLDSDDQSILFLRYFEEMSYAEIAEVVRRPEGTIRYRVHMAKSALKKRLEDLDG